MSNKKEQKKVQWTQMVTRGPFVQGVLGSIKKKQKDVLY